MAQLKRVPLPAFGRAAAAPTTNVETYETRLAATLRAMGDADLDVLVVYADRERFSDMEYLCSIDPRFEEGFLVLGSNGSRTVYLGNECQAYGPPAALKITQRLYQELSPPGQLRDRPRQLHDLLADTGIGPGTVVGTAGGKTMDARYVTDPARSHTLPSYLVDGLRDLAGHEHVVNAEHLFLDPDRGMRMTVTAEEIAQFEYAATLTSDGVRAAQDSLRTGAQANELADTYIHRGLPFSAHAMVNFGAKASRGLSSPTPQQACHGDAYQLAFGLRGALTCRAGVIARDASDLPADIASDFPDLAANYYDTLVAWYQALRLGATTGEVYRTADAARDPGVFDFALNPGHFLHTEEWSQSTFTADGQTILRSGMALQGDIIPAVQGPFRTVNIEDGIVLADASLRREVQSSYPEMWNRMVQRREFITESLGIDLDEAVLLMSNMPLWHRPYVLAPDLAIVT